MAQSPDIAAKSEIGMIRIKGSGELKEAKIAMVWGDRLKPPSRSLQSIINLREGMMTWTDIPVTIVNQVRLGSPDIHKLPILFISTGEQFDLTETEKKNLRDYIQNGGFIVADGTMNDASGAALLQMVRDVAGNKRLEAIPSSHPIFQKPFLYDGAPRGSAESRQVVMPSNSPGRAALTDEVVGLSGVFINGRLAILYSPRGYYNVWNSGSGLKFGVNLIMYAIEGS
ncbi:MAG: DUF4159 domain-containing protein [Candidatus Latescibacterota bacterium]